MRQERPMVSDQLLLHNGRRLDCEVSALSGGMTLVRFTTRVERLVAPARQLITAIEPRALNG